MYQYVRKRELRPYREQCSKLLQALVQQLKKDLGCIDFQLVGSGGSHLVVQNGKGIFDLDYNLCFSELPEKWASNPGALKACVRECMDTLCPQSFSFGKDSTSCITYWVYKGNDVCFNLDVGILMDSENGWTRLIYDKPQNAYIWNLVRNSDNIHKKATYIHHKKKWNDLRTVYLSTKNQNLLAKNEQPSFETYVKVVNDLYNRLKQKER